MTELANRGAGAASRHTELAQALLAAIHAQEFAATPDAWRGGAPVAQFPSIDLAVVQFQPAATPRWANVLFSRDHPRGLVGEVSGTAGSVRNVRFDADQRDAQLQSAAWAPDADWSRLQWRAICPDVGVDTSHESDSGRCNNSISTSSASSRAGTSASTRAHGTVDADTAHRQHRFVAPYPASLLKLMVAVGVGLAVDCGLCGWPDALEPMLTVSDNAATDACVALLHRVGMVDTLNATLAALDLRTLQLNGTTPQGGWRNADGAGVGRIHMTAWDTVRLLWLLDAGAPPPPWLAPGTRLLQPASRGHLRSVLQRQQHDHVLSSGSLRGLPGWVPGLPDAPAFAHKTGSTDNYASDAGIVRVDDRQGSVDGVADGSGCHYLIALLSSLGRRHAAVAGHPHCVTTWRLPALGAAVHRLLSGSVPG